MNVERDKFLTEAMGECGHEWKRSCGCCPGYCKKCGAEEGENNDFSEWEGFGKLWTWAQKQEWWSSFVYKMAFEFQGQKQVFCEAMIHPDRFADEIYAGLKERA